MGAAKTGSLQLYYETITWGDKYSKVTHHTCLSSALIRIIQEHPGEVRPEQMSSVTHLQQGHKQMQKEE